jgi:hypothetical protein
MGKVHPEIDSQIADFIRAQRLFFVGTASAGSSGRVNHPRFGRTHCRLVWLRRSDVSVRG